MSPVATAPALVVQFFLIPLAVVAAVVLVYGGFRLLLSNERTPQEFLSDVRSGGRERRWPAAYELSKMMADPDIQATYPELGPALVRAFADSEGDDPRVRQYLALAIGRLSPVPPEALTELMSGLDDADSETVISVLWALGALGDTRVVPDVERLYQSADEGIRKMVVYALGAFGEGHGLSTLQTALEDTAPDVQWNAAVALAQRGRDDGLAVLRRMLDREYITRTVTRAPRREAEIDPVSEVMISGLNAVGTLGADSLRTEVEALSQADDSLKVRQAALEALDRIDSSPSPVSARYR